jgi:hypothetical protein
MSGSETEAGASATGWSLFRDGPTGAGMSCPVSWVRVEVPGPSIVMAVAVSADRLEPGQFRPNVVLTVERVAAGSEDLRVFSPGVVEGFLASVLGAYVVAVDLYPLPGGREGRRMVAAYRQPPHAVVLSQWWTVVGGIATAVSASCSADQYLALEPAFEGFLSGFTPATSAPEAAR